MSLKLRFDSPSEGGLMPRSKSFTGFGSLTGQQRSSSGPNTYRSKSISGGKTAKVYYPTSRRGDVGSVKPDEVDLVFQALRRGLNIGSVLFFVTTLCIRECLEGHQTEMDFLSSQQRETKRNSRLAFLYDLEKEIRALERYIRRLEFQISKVEELYENYCIQWKMSRGAVNMKRAFSLSPSSRASRESLLELSRSHRLSLQDMSMMEGELEILLGELHIKMKGLIGFARLCPGDQYEVVVRLGRQRWRIRGRIDSEDSQTWDEEEMVFLPHIHHNFEIKVTEAKGLGWLLVGMVTCASADFFVTRPQLMLVDVTELGTIKLQLEVTWNPFDSSEKMRPLFVNRHSAASRKSSVYSWTAPSTPSFTEKYFLSMVQGLQNQDGSLSSLVSKSHNNRGSISLMNYLSHPSHTTTSNQDTRMDSISHGTSLGGSQSQLSLEEGVCLEEEEEEEEGEEREDRKAMEEESWERRTSAPITQVKRETSSVQRSSTPDILRKNKCGDAEKHTGLDGLTQDSDKSLPTCVSSSSAVPHSSTTVADPAIPRSGPGRAQHRAQAFRLSVLVSELEKILQNQHGTEKQLRVLQHQIMHLATILKNDLSLLRSSSEEETLAVEEVLDSFDFLSHDLSADDDSSCLGSMRLKDSGMGSFQQSTLRSLGLISQNSQSASEEELLVAPLTTGNWRLDQTLETHLDLCCILLKTMATTEFSLARTDLLEEMSLQASVLDTISCLLLEKKDNVAAADLIPKNQRRKDVLSFWDQCMLESSSPFGCHADCFSRMLQKSFTHKLKAKQSGHSEKVFHQLLQQVQAPCRTVPCPQSVCSPERVTIFQLSVYLNRWSVLDFGGHISRLSKEEHFLSALQGPNRRQALNRLKGRSLSRLFPLNCTLQTLALLLADANHKICKSAAECVSRAAACRSFRRKALIYFTERLKDPDINIQHGSCLALKYLKATESVDHIAELWRSEDEDVRAAARETILSFGKKGHVAFQRMDQLFCESEEEAYQNKETHTTIL
ncbi:RIPOR family member 3-like isoform X1 [Synchiropus splendidus]|uniref:RIPOR family member 3-like isoform X1 n=1 Tax=Synchiropus splendidus TaxID=270530 RepID=UPI00237E364E|nr:RIPOR family member 3-like isoform X1 [Synchiropus splendidus]